MVLAHKIQELQSKSLKSYKKLCTGLSPRSTTKNIPPASKAITSCLFSVVLTLSSVRREQCPASSEQGIGAASTFYCLVSNKRKRTGTRNNAQVPHWCNEVKDIKRHTVCEHKVLYKEAGKHLPMHAFSSMFQTRGRKFSVYGIFSAPVEPCRPHVLRKAEILFFILFFSPALPFPPPLVSIPTPPSPAQGQPGMAISN